MAGLEDVGVFLEESEEETERESPPNPTRGAGQTCNFKRKYETAAEATRAIKSLGCWAQDYGNSTSAGRKVVYRCNQMRRRPTGALPCGAKRMLHYHPDSGCVSVYRNDMQHEHSDAATRPGIPEATKTLIHELFVAGVRKPKGILAALEQRNSQLPHKKTLENYLVTLRKQLYGQPSISFAELEQWCNGHSQFPTDDDQAFVAGHLLRESVNVDEQNVRIFITTPRLLMGGEPLSAETVQAFIDRDTQCSWQSADDYRSWRHSIWLVTIDTMDWEAATCTCPVFAKKLICKHSLGIAIRTKLVQAPQTARTIPIGQKRKRGRPSLATAALRRD